MKKCNLTSQYILNSADIGTVEVIENTNFTLCQEPIDTITSPEVTQSLSYLQTYHSNTPVEPKSKTTRFLNHKDFMYVASKLIYACNRIHQYATIVCGIMLNMLDIAKGHEATNIVNFKESIEKSSPQLIQKYTAAFKPVKIAQ